MDECKKICLENKSCRGGSYNLKTNICSLNRNNGNIVNNVDSIAIVREQIYYIYQLRLLNEKLINLNNQILSIINEYYPKFQKNILKQHLRNKYLQNNSNNLNNERLRIANLMNDYQSLNSAKNDSELIVETNYSTYTILLVICIILFLVLLSILFFGNSQKGGGNNFIKDCLFLITLMIFFLSLSQLTM